MLINDYDNVSVKLSDGHKYARRNISEGENIIKYGQPIGHATRDIGEGEHVHTHNMKTNLSDNLEYVYEREIYETEAFSKKHEFWGYERENGDVGIRNDIWIVNTVGCVNKIAQKLSEMTGAKYFPHPFGCSQMGGDQKITQLILKGMVNHPNAGGVLVLGLGCENNNIDEFKKVLGTWDEKRVRFLNAQDCDEIAEGVRLINELKSYAAGFERKKFDISRLKVGLKCGGSDGYSGITANPLLGRLSDRIINAGGSCVLTEVPEMFGAEHLLMKRARNDKIFDKIVRLVNDFKDYYKKHDQVIYENPSPGNKKGGITTLEEKSLGCIRKGGLSEVVDVLDYGDTVKMQGLSLLNGPGNDIVAITNLMAAGVHMILFTTGRGTPVGGAVPTIKISTNTALFEKKPDWIDFNAGTVCDGKDPIDDLTELVKAVANGQKTKNEENGYEEISIFKDGVVL